MMLYRVVLLSGVMVLSTAVSISAVSANELSGLDAQQREVVVVDGPKDGGAIVVKEETNVIEPVIVTQPAIEGAPPLPQAIAQDRLNDAEASENFDVIQQRLQSAVETPVPAVQDAIERNIMQDTAQ